MITRARASALIFAGAAIGATASLGGAQTNVTMRIATIPIEAAAEAYYATDMGFFSTAGLVVDLQVMSNSAAIAAALVSNTVDIGFGNPDVLAGLRSKGIIMLALAGASEYVSPMHIVGLLLPANSPVNQAKDLNGKIVAVGALHSIAVNDTRAWSDQHGGDSSTIKFVEVPIPAMPAALDAGRIDAAFVSEPFLSIAAKTHRVLAYGYDAVSKHFINGAWFCTPQWAKDNPDLAKRFATVMRSTAAWANANPDKSGAILAKYAKIDPDIIATMARIRYPEQLTPALLQPLIDVSAKYNGFDTFPAAELIYTPPR